MDPAFDLEGPWDCPILGTMDPFGFILSFENFSILLQVNNTSNSSGQNGTIEAGPSVAVGIYWPGRSI